LLLAPLRSHVLGKENGVTERMVARREWQVREDSGSERWRYLDLGGLSAEDLRGGGAFLQEESQRVFLQTHVPDGPGRLPGLLARVHEHQHLQAAQSAELRNDRSKFSPLSRVTTSGTGCCCRR